MGNPWEHVWGERKQYKKDGWGINVEKQQWNADRNKKGSERAV